MKHLFLAMCLAVAVAISGCGENGLMEQVEERAKEAVERADNGDEGDAEGEYGIFGSASLPDGFPDDVHIYEGAAITHSSRDGGRMVVALRTGDEATNVLEAYEEKAKADGWELEAEHQMGGVANRSYLKGDRRLVVNINAQEDGTVVNLAISE